MHMATRIQPYFDERTYTLTYVVYDDETRDAVLVDPVLDYEPSASAMWTESADLAINFVKEKNLNLHYILETHAHADHLSGAPRVKEAFPEAKTAIGARIREVQALFKKVFNLPDEFPTDGSQFDKLLEDNEVIEAGSLKIKTLYTPGHTPACASYLVNDEAVFTGDTLFMPDYGTGRCDFPGGSSADLYESVTQRLYTLPDGVRTFVGHDYLPGGRPVAYQATIAEQKEGNVQLPASRSKEEFRQRRDGRDATLAAPRLLLQSLQVNINAGGLPQAESNDKVYLRIPVNVFRPKTMKQETLVLEEV
jgi:glyoxylase-like metal-dependent hydrolase (beta-lactamase superfamily II)